MALPESSLLSLPQPERIEAYFDRLWPICRSITGDGFRRSLEILSEIIPLEKHEVPSGTKVLDWEVPDEWNIEDAYVMDASGRRVIDFRENNLHVLGYSVPVDEELSLAELDEHLYSLPDMPEAIPYLTSYYKRRWGFCVSHRVRQSLQPGKYRVVIRSTLRPGSLTYGELVLPSTKGRREEVLLSSYLCHPSMANNELSGPLVMAFLYEALKGLKDREFNYRFVIVPETIGSITYLSRWGEHLREHCVAGYVLTSCGDPNGITYKRSRRHDSLADRCAVNAIQSHSRETGSRYQVLDFFPTGSDERQYCSPGYNLPVGSLMRSWVGKYREYHTSLDNKDFITFAAMRESVELYLKTVLNLESEGVYLNLLPCGEPNLGKRGLYPTLGSRREQDAEVKRVMYLLNYADGTKPLSEVASLAEAAIYEMAATARTLEKHGLLRKQE